MYKLLRSLLFNIDAEKAHHLSMNALKIACSIGFIRRMIGCSFASKNIPAEIPGLRFKNPVGLAAGFDKNAKYLRELEALGFSHVEIGTVTPKPQDGNEKPRLFRLPADKALINRMGFNNDGVEIVASRLKKWREIQHSTFNIQHSKLIIGGNIGKNKTTPNENAWKDYEICFNSLHPYVDYFVVNVSSPNTPGLRELQEKDALHKILTNLQEQNKKFDIPKPIFLKIAPDLSTEQIDDVIELALEIKLDGLVISNTTLNRSNLSAASTRAADAAGAGGLSGMPVKKRSTEILQYVHDKTGGKIPLIASGGIFTAADAKEKLNAGASLLQVYTGFIYEGPGIVKKIMNKLYGGVSGSW
ncbi:MAG: quinone-dependent dihydroorotate dehydrogenase [Ferruginibacter sp.]